MKRQTIKVIALTFIWLILISLIILIPTFAKTDLKLSLTANKSAYKVGDEIEVRIKLSQKVKTASFYLNYNSSAVSFKEAKTQSVTTKDYSSDNLVRAVYADMSGTGTNEIVFSFIVKDDTNSNVTFSLSKATMASAEEKSTYSQNEISFTNSQLEVGIEGNNSQTPTPTQAQTIVPTKTDNTTKDKELPKTGENDLIICLTIILVFVTIYLGYNLNKIKKLIDNK